MKFKICMLLAMLIGFSNSETNAQCATCKDALIKDYLTIAVTANEQMLLLHFIDKSAYHFLKTHYENDTLAPLVHTVVMGSKDYEDFTIKRAALNEFTSFIPVDENIESALRSTGASLEFTNYTTCADDCAKKTPDLIYTVLTKTDETNFYVKVKFNAGSGSKVWVNISAIGENALVQKPDATYFTANATIKLNKNKEYEFNFKRSDKTNFSGFKIKVDGKEMYSGKSLFKAREPNADILVTATITAKDSLKKFIKTESAIVSSPNLYKVMSNDSLCKAKRGFANGMWCAVKNTIELPNLPLTKNLYYTNFTKPEPISTEKKEVAYGKFNKMAGMREVQKTGIGNKSAKIEFITTSGNCTWQWKADVFEFTEKLSKQQKTSEVKHNFFSVEVPEHSMDAIINLRINGNKYELKTGSNHKDAQVYLMFANRSNGIMKYKYFVFK